MYDPLDTCPVKPLGVSADLGECHFRLPGGREVTLPTNGLHKLRIIALFQGDTSWLEQHFPIIRETFTRNEPFVVRHKYPDGFDQAEAAEWLVAHCARAGIVSNPEPKLAIIA
ncbi:hypothetical protein HT136_01305 [Novosphingobium profundi]|uniref:hypothetical protein n=1 Tax=Novosphingobium profundi TaxID=1774954 RepID=UPI001BDAB12F|nr:hypothetical protein [Novosphingobium profundi]MBT0667003.1 hypothetical protein [Novosphingobium profundi]